MVWLSNQCESQLIWIYAIKDWVKIVKDLIGVSNIIKRWI